MGKGARKQGIVACSHRLTRTSHSTHTHIHPPPPTHTHTHTHTHTGCAAAADSASPNLCDVKSDGGMWSTSERMDDAAAVEIRVVMAQHQLLGRVARWALRVSMALWKGRAARGCMRAHTHPHTHAHAHTRTHTHTRARTQSRTHTRTHIHTLLLDANRFRPRCPCERKPKDLHALNTATRFCHLADAGEANTS